MPHTKVLIAVKTYPTISTKYDELVCTAGFREDGTWIRIYPIPYRKLPYDQQYKKYDWVEVELVKNDSDARPESFRPRSLDSEIKVVGHLGTERNWFLRKQMVLQKVYTNLRTLIAEAKEKSICTSLAVFRPTAISDFIIEPAEREWSADRLAQLQQQNLFEGEVNAMRVVRKLPYKFSYTLRDDEGRQSTMMIEDWETGELYWHCLRRNEGDENRACEQVRQKYMDDFAKTKDLYLFLGTTALYHIVAPNPFIIIGTFHPKDDPQYSLPL
jgi:hypothetical protein